MCNWKFPDLDLGSAIWQVCNFLTGTELIWLVLSTISRVAESYNDMFLKNSTSVDNGEGLSAIPQSVKTNIPDTNTFLHDNETKSWLIKIFFNCLIVNRIKVLNILTTTNLYLTTERSCQRLSLSADINLVDNLLSTHEETDFRLIVHAYDTLSILTVQLKTSYNGRGIFFLTSLIFYIDTGAGRKIV